MVIYTGHNNHNNTNIIKIDNNIISNKNKDKKDYKNNVYTNSSTSPIKIMVIFFKYPKNIMQGSKFKNIDCHFILIFDRFLIL